MPTYKITVEYEGTRYSGGPAQGNTDKTVAGKIMRAAEQVVGSAVEVGGAGRTDAGVHAAGQVAHLRINKAIEPQLLARKINDLLPHDIHIVGSERANDRFHARHDAQSRIYMYQIATRRTAFAKPFVWWIKDRLDVEAMTKAALAIPGRHEFTAFADKRLAADESRIVVVERFEVAEVGDMILVRVAASHFLWKMVRKLVAALAEVGRGSMTAEEYAAKLKPRAELFQPTAPPSGLFFETVTYPGEVFDRPLVPIVPVTTLLTRKAQ